MKKKFMRGIAAALAILMMTPASVFAGEQNEIPDSGNPEEQIMPLTTSISIDKEIYAGDSAKKTATLTLTGVAEGTTIISWTPVKGTGEVSVSAGSGMTATVTAVKAGTASVVATYMTDGDFDTAQIDIEVKEYAIADAKITSNTKTSYVAGQKINKSDIEVKVEYTDGSEATTTSFTYTPDGALKKTDDTLTVTVSGYATPLTKSLEVIELDTEDLVDTIEIVSPTSATEFGVGGKLKKSDVKVKVNYLDKTSSTASLTENTKISYSGIDFGTSGTYTFSADDAKTKPTLKVSYGNAEASVTLNVKAEVASDEKEIKNVYVSTPPTKTTYKVGESFKPDGLVMTLVYGSGKTLTVAYNNVNASKFNGTDTTTKFTTAGTVAVTVKYYDQTTGKTFNAPAFNVTVKDAAAINVTKLSNTTSGSYKYILKEDATVKIGDDDLDWEDFFESITIVYKNSSNKTKYEEIEDQDELEDFLEDRDARLRLVVYDKDENEDEIEEDDVKNGKVTLVLYLDYAGEQFDSSSEYIKFSMEISGIGCTVGLYSYPTSTSSSYTNVYDDLESALEAIEAEDDIEDELGAKLSSRTIKIKLGEDQEFKPSSKNRFAPDYENDIIIDLNGYELELKSDWIDYDDCEDIKVTITNTSDEDATLIYTDLGTTLLVTEDAELEFSDGKVPMDSGAEITLTLLRTASSTTAIKTKIFDDLKDALDAIEVEDDFEDEIGEELGSSNVIKIKLGEDQNLSSYEFAPDYDNSIYIDLNGHTLKLKSEWIDYDDCEDLTVYMSNSNKDKEATLTYSDLSKSIKLKQGDASLKFEEDKIPGLYKVTVAEVKNGTVKADKETVAHGSDVTFTITPETGYAINTVKVGTKTITDKTEGYTVSSKGVGTYKMSGVTADATITVTFKKSETATESTTTDTANWKNPFTDISTRDQYYDAIAYVVQNGMFNGMSATKFEPKGTTTRAQYVTVLGRLAGVDVSKYKTSRYNDVSTSDQSIAYAVPYIEWASDVGIIQGYGNGKFGPKDNITHQQMYLMMYRYAMFVEGINVSLAGVSLSNIRDNSEIANWAEDGVKFASRYGILITSGGKLTPADNALRCELAMLLHGFCTKVIEK